MGASGSGEFTRPPGSAPLARPARAAVRLDLCDPLPLVYPTPRAATSANPPRPHPPRPRTADGPGRRGPMILGRNAVVRSLDGRRPMRYVRWLGGVIGIVGAVGPLLAQTGSGDAVIRQPQAEVRGRNSSISPITAYLRQGQQVRVV